MAAMAGLDNSMDAGGAAGDVPALGLGDIPAEKTGSGKKTSKLFSIHEKLDIIDEIKRGDQTQVEIIKAHETSKSSVLRWKKAEGKMREEAGLPPRELPPTTDLEKNQLDNTIGIGAVDDVPALGARDVPFVDGTEFLNENEAPKPEAETALLGKRPAEETEGTNNEEGKKAKKVAKYFSLQEKLDILQEIKRGDRTQAEIVAAHQTSKSSVLRWKKMEEKMREEVDEGKRGKLKRTNLNDGLKRIKKAVLFFCDLNRALPKDLQVPITEGAISTRSLLIKDRLLEKNAIDPFLTDKEKFEITKFTASRAWAGKLVRQLGLKSANPVAAEIAKLQVKIEEYGLI